MKELTAKQRRILDYIIEYLKNTGRAPTYRDIAAHFGYKSLRTVYDHIKALQDRGYLLKDSKKSRAIFPAQNLNVSQAINVYDDIAQTYPVISENQIVDTLFICADWAKNHDLFAIKMPDESMIEAHILPGDFIIIDREATIYSEDIIAIIIGGATTLRFYELREDYIILRPANKEVSEIILPKNTQKLKIIGKVITIIRKVGHYG